MLELRSVIFACFTLTKCASSAAALLVHRFAGGFADAKGSALTSFVVIEPEGQSA
jgi:hypothetical protein